MSGLLLPEIESYRPEEWTEAFQWLPVVKKYKSWIDTPKPQDPAALLRWVRHRGWLQAALATYFDRASTSDICLTWSLLCEDLLDQAWRACGLDDLPICMTVVGKMGSQELNLSSDIDMFFVSQIGMTPAIDRALKRFRALLADPTENGFVIRLDFDLRPGGRFAPLVSTLPQLEDYYWSQGETWERLAMVRARTLLGPTDLCAAVQQTLTAFTYRRFLDYTLLDDLRQLRSRIHQHYQTPNQDEFHVKAGIGGLRDIELFVHALQVLHGGKDRGLRTHSTSKALMALRDRRILPENDLSHLETTYWQFRHLEHLVQIPEDRQTHLLNLTQLPRSHRSCDRDTIEHLRSGVDTIVTSLLGSAISQESSLPSTPEDQECWLRDLGFSEDSVTRVWPELINQTAKSTRLERDETSRRKFLHNFVIETAKSGLDKNLGLSLLSNFTQSIRAKATFFTLLAREPRIVRDLARLFSTSPYLGSILALRPELIDSFVFKSHEGFSADLELQLEQMAEYRLLTEIIAANQFLNDRNPARLSDNLSRCADYLTHELLKSLDTRAPNQALSLIALGKWGGRELGFRSDLDVVFVSPQTPNQEDHKIAKRFINRLSDVHKGGRIYNIDLRLRPSGSAGPMIVSFESLREFLRERAQAWERQAYLKARPFGELEFSIRSLVSQRGLSSPELTELRDIRNKLIVPATSSAVVNLKHQVGGLVDVELGVQTMVLYNRLSPEGPAIDDMIKALINLQPTASPRLKTLARNYTDLRTIEQMYQLAANHSGSNLEYSSAEGLRLSQLLGSTPETTSDRVAHLLNQNTEILKDLDPVRKAP